jgi:hypothetical protein
MVTGCHHVEITISHENLNATIKARMFVRYDHPPVLLGQAIVGVKKSNCYEISIL